MNFSAAYATTVERPRLEYSADLRTHSPLRGLFYVAYSGMDSGRFFGIGNETAQTNTTPGFYDLRQEKFIANALAEVPLLGPLRARAGILLESVHTRDQGVIAELQPYGAGWMTLPGGELGIVLDTRTGALTSQRGFKLLATVRYSPAWIDNEHAFTKLRGEAAAALGAHVLTDLLLDLRVAGERNWGQYPFFDAAYVGGVAFRSGLDLSATEETISAIAFARSKRDADVPTGVVSNQSGSSQPFSAILVRMASLSFATSSCLVGLATTAARRAPGGRTASGGMARA